MCDSLNLFLARQENKEIMTVNKIQDESESQLTNLVTWFC